MSRLIIVSSIFGLLSTLSNANTCNFGMVESMGWPFLMSENTCNWIDGEISGNSASFSMTFECSDQNVGFATYYTTTDCTGDANQTVQLDNYSCCVECDSVCQDIPIIVDYYEDTETCNNTEGTVSASMSIYAMPQTDYCGTAEFFGNDLPTLVTITETKWKYEYFAGSNSENCPEGSGTSQVFTTGCQVFGDGFSLLTNYNNNTIHTDPDTTRTPTTTMTTQSNVDCPDYFARFEIDFIVYDSSGDISDNDICGEDYSSFIETIIVNDYGITIDDSNTVLTVTSDCDSSDGGSSGGSDSGGNEGGSSEGGGSSGEGGSDNEGGSGGESSDNSGNSGRRLLQEGGNSGENSDSGGSSGEGSDNEGGGDSDNEGASSGEGGSSGENSDSDGSGGSDGSSSDCAEISFQVVVEYTTDTDISSVDFSTIASGLTSSLSSSSDITVSVSYLYECYSLDCCSSSDWTNSCTDEESSSCASLSSDYCDASTSGDSGGSAGDDSAANGSIVGYAIACIMLIGALIAN